MMKYVLGVMLLVSLVLALLWGNARNNVTELEAENTTLSQERDTLQTTLTTERAKAAAVNAVGTRYEERKNENVEKGAAVTAAVASGDLQLRKEWAGCETQLLSTTTAAAVELGEARRLREESAGQIVQIVADCDAQVTGLQEAYEEAMR